MSKVFYKTRKLSKGWLAWAALVPLVANHPLREPPSTEVYFDFANTEEEAIARVKSECSLASTT